MTQHKGEPPLLIGDRQSVKLLVNSWIKPGPFIAINWENARSDGANLSGGFHLTPDEADKLIAMLQSASAFAHGASEAAGRIVEIERGKPVLPDATVIEGPINLPARFQALGGFDTTEEIPF